MSNKPAWQPSNIPDQTGTTVLITGANSGIGYETARTLASRGAEIILACRNQNKANAAVESIQAESPDAKLTVVLLDLGDLASVNTAAETILDQHDAIDLLINNAGIMMVPYGTTVDGFERQFGTNHLGHFALTARLLELVEAAPAGRIVTISSLAHRGAELDLADLNYGDGATYSPQPAYRRSKFANLVFSYELERRLHTADSSALSVAAHPGVSRTNLASHFESTWWGKLATPWMSLFLQNAEAGALPTLRAATDPDVVGGTYYGPARFMESTGDPVVVESSDASHDEELAARLWAASESLTGLTLL